MSVHWWCYGYSVHFYLCSLISFYICILIACSRQIFILTSYVCNLSIYISICCVLMILLYNMFILFLSKNWNGLFEFILMFLMCNIVIGVLCILLWLSCVILFLACFVCVVFHVWYCHWYVVYSLVFLMCNIFNGVFCNFLFLMCNTVIGVLYILSYFSCVMLSLVCYVFSCVSRM